MKNLKQNQIDRYLSLYSHIKELPPPKSGWVKYIRNALGMTTQQLANRLKVTRANVARIEQAEMHNGITLKALSNVAQAMNCRLVYAIVPNTTIKQIIEEQARKYVKKHLNEVSYHMALESQTVKDKKALEAQIEDLVQKFLSKSTKAIWDE